MGRAKKTTQDLAGARLLSVPFPWSLAVHHQSLAFRARLYDEKNEAPEEEAGSAVVAVEIRPPPARTKIGALA